jgi:Ion channel
MAQQPFLGTGSAVRGGAVVHERRRQFRKVVLTLLKALASTVALVVIYYLLPLDDTSIGVAVGMLVVGLLALIVLVTFQVRSIIKAPYPALRAVDALATSVPLFLLLFAATYFVMGSIAADNFSEPISRTDALYFTITVFSTVGFGDITAKTEVTRALVTGQMLAGVVIVGLGARIIVDAIQHGRQQQPPQDGDSGLQGDRSAE